MLGKLYALVDEQCCEDNPDALTSHEVHQFTICMAPLCCPSCLVCSGAAHISRTADVDIGFTDAQVLLPGHLLMRFTREKLEDCLAALKDSIARDAARSPEAVNLQVGRCCTLHCALHACSLSVKATACSDGAAPVGVSIVLLSESMMMSVHPLQDESYMRKLADRMPDIGRKMEYMLNTGNLVSKSGLDLSQSSGFTVVAEKLNFFRWASFAHVMQHQSI